MNIYDINVAILACFDDETGELLNEERLEQLCVEKNEKIENVALWLKNMQHKIAALKDEENKLKERREHEERAAESLKRWLINTTGGKKFETTRVKIGWRSSTTVEVDDEFISWAMENNDDLLTYKPPTANKTKIKEMLKSCNVPHAIMVDKINMQIK